MKKRPWLAHFFKKMNLLKFDVIVHAGTSIKSGKMPQTVDLV